MSKMKSFTLLAIAALALVGRSEEESDLFGVWRIAVGGAFNGPAGITARARNLPVPAGYVIPAGLTESAAFSDAQNHIYGDGFIRDDDNTAASGTTVNWKLPVGTYSHSEVPGQEFGRFDLANNFEYVSRPADFSRAHDDNSSDPCQFGISVEASRELWVHSEPFEDRYGVDFAAAFSYFFRRDIYREKGSVTRTDHIGTGAYQTQIEARDTMYSYIEETDPNYRNYPENGFYGKGVSTDSGEPALIMANIGTPQRITGAGRDEISQTFYDASGDYRELEMLFMLRPWYEITTWWRVFGEVGLGVSWGRFETDFSATGVDDDETFDQWDCYGVAGLGTMFRYKRIDLSVDVFGRFLRDDMDIDGEHVKGSIDRSNWGLRVMVGVDF